MAEEVIKKLEDQLNCPLCLGTFTDPKLLQCNHIFCRDCLAKRMELNSNELPCPTCQQVTPVPPAGVADLQPAFQTNHLLEIVCKHKEGKQDVLYCSQHHNRELELYCETCEELICFQCTIQQHNGHKYNLIGEVFEKHKQEIMSSLNQAEQQLTLVSEALEMLDACSGDVFTQQAILQSQIRTHEHGVRETELISKLNYISQEKLNELESQRKQAETSQEKLRSVLDMVKETLRTSSQGVVLRMKKGLLEQVKDLTTAFKSDILKLDTEVDMVFMSSKAAGKPHHTYTQGFVTSATVPEPSRCCALSRVPDVTTVGEKYSTLLQVKTQEGKSFKKFVLSLECELVSELTGTTAKGDVERTGQSQYEVSYQPTIKGRHQLHIKVLGEHIKGSPFLLVAKSSLMDINTPILTLDHLKAPHGIAVNGTTGEVVVTERDANCVSVFSPNGEKLRSFGTEGSGHGEFNSPRGVAVDSKGNILVADCCNNRVQKFTAEGQLLKVKGGGKHQRFYCVNDLAVNANNNKVYVVDDTHRVQVLNSDLSFSGAFGRRGETKGEFYSPCSIACDSAGSVYVADCNGARVQVFTPSGKFLRTFRTYNYPCRIAIGSEGRVHVSCSSRHLSIFTSEGELKKSLGEKDSLRSKFLDSRGLAVDSSGVVYLCDCDNTRIIIL